MCCDVSLVEKAWGEILADQIALAPHVSCKHAVAAPTNMCEVSQSITESGKHSFCPL